VIRSVWGGGQRAYGKKPSPNCSGTGARRLFPGLIPGACARLSRDCTCRRASHSPVPAAADEFRPIPWTAIVIRAARRPMTHAAPAYSRRADAADAGDTGQVQPLFRHRPWRAAFSNLEFDRKSSPARRRTNWKQEIATCPNLGPGRVSAGPRWQPARLKQDREGGRPFIGAFNAGYREASARRTR